MLVSIDCQAMSARHLKIVLVTGIFIIVTFTAAAKILNRNKHDPTRRIEGRIDELPPAFRNKIADALTARGRDSSFMRPDEIPEVAPIIGGTDAPKHKYPWYVHVLYAYYNDYFYFICGGTVYNERTIITAGHCLEDDPEQEYGVFAIIAGDYDLSVEEELEQIAFADDIRLHKRSRRSGAYVSMYDIGLLILDQPLSFTTIAVKPVPNLSTRKKDKLAVKSNNCVAIGNGIYVQRPYVLFPYVLQELSHLNFASERDCHKALWENEYSLTPRMICSIGQNAGACFGDSGSPAGCYDNDGVYYQVGIVSWGPVPDGRCTGLTVYTRISKFLRWIKYYSYRV